MIGVHEIEAAQASWGRAVVNVGATASWDKASALATELVENHYQLEDGTLLFCPTKASEKPFRTTLKEVVSYFVGGDRDHGEDSGFALEPWSSIRFENHGVVSREDVGIAMGHYYFGRQDGSELKVEYSFVYVRDAQGILRIQLHHSALPYSF
jgi:hypothetical protein